MKALALVRAGIIGATLVVVAVAYFDSDVHLLSDPGLLVLSVLAFLSVDELLRLWKSAPPPPRIPDTSEELERHRAALRYFLRHETSLGVYVGEFSLEEIRAAIRFFSEDVVAHYSREALDGLQAAYLDTDRTFQELGGSVEDMAAGAELLERRAFFADDEARHVWPCGLRGLPKAFSGACDCPGVES